MRIALGSDRAAKVAAVRSTVARIALVDGRWREAEVIAREVASGVSAMPLTDDELMCGARRRAEAVRDLLALEGAGAELYLGLEGGFHSFEHEGVWYTFLRGWAYASDGERGSYGLAPSILVPDSIARRVTEGRMELGAVMDEVAGQQDVRSRQGAWGVLSRDLLTRAESFEAALIAALAPFYNAGLYT